MIFWMQVCIRNTQGSAYYCLYRDTKPDICIAISILARYNAKPKFEHWNCLMHLWNYVVSTKDKCIYLSSESNLKVNCDVDASWSMTIPDKKSERVI
uniref:Uncharacterized protein n=1 Tax=Strigamia maritima TaxID=126957 RepID=T1IQH4_STRMM